MDVCREVKESSKTLLQKSSKSIMQVTKDVKLQQLYVLLWGALLPSFLCLCNIILDMLH